MRGFLARLLGNRGERAAAKFLKQKGYRILARQYRNNIGEIDLIARDGDTFVFVEVKTRRSDTAGSPTDAITYQKQQQLTRTALAYLKHKKLLLHSARFDVIAIIWPHDQAHPEIKHYENAFTTTGSGQMFS